MKQVILSGLLNLLNSIGNSSSFICLTYKNKQNEISKYFLLYNFNCKNLYSRSLLQLQSIKNTLHSTIELLAYNEIEISINDSLTKGIGNNINYTKKGYYTPDSDNKNIKQHNETIYLNGYCIAKRILVKGNYKQVNSSDKTICKNKIKKHLKMNKFREFILNQDSLIAISANNQKYIIQKEFNQ